MARLNTFTFLISIGYAQNIMNITQRKTIMKMKVNFKETVA